KRQPSYPLHQVEQLAALRVQTRPSILENLQGAKAVARVEGLGIVVQAEAVSDVTGVCIPPKPQAPEKPLYLCKWYQASAAPVIGDVVTFYLRYTNPGGRPITDVAVSDSLTSRLEYLPGSARSDRDAVFTTQANEAGSVMLNWKINGRLLPGQSGTL